MDDSWRSYLKTGILAAVASTALGLLAYGSLQLPGRWFGLIGAAILGAGALAVLLVAVASLVVLWRCARDKRGAADLFTSLNSSRSPSRLAQHGGFRSNPLRRLAARLLVGHSVLPGDEIEVRSLEEILATLDENGMCDGLPFQVEMIRFCGSKCRVFRNLDKIYDYGRTKGLRRLRNGVLLAGLICDGSAHGGCQAMCYIIWHTRWLKRPGGHRNPSSAATNSEVGRVEWLSEKGHVLPDAYACQYTSLHAASSPFARHDLRAVLLPWVAGNITLRALLVAQLTGLFNAAQEWRGGAGYPRAAASGPANETLPVPAHLEAGDIVRVRTAEEIGRTLDSRSMHRGLWFDRDMLKHCGFEYVVAKRVDRIIDDATGKMRTMKTPCIVLEDVCYSGEFLKFNAQSDPLFWREHWLLPVRINRLPDSPQRPC